MERFSYIVLSCFVYAVAGWLWETIYCSLKNGRFVSRGFLKGPYCPIYGIGALLVLHIILPLRSNLFEIFILSAFAMTVLEYVTGILLEKFFQTRLWNYDYMPLNFRGRVALPVSLFWGLVCVLLVRYIHPDAVRLVRWLYENLGAALPIALTTIIAVDTIVSTSQMNAFKKAMNALNQHLEDLKISVYAGKEAMNAAFTEYKTGAKQLMEEWSAKAKAYIDAKQTPYLKSMLIKYPNAKMDKINNFKFIKEQLTKKKNK